MWKSLLILLIRAIIQVNAEDVVSGNLLEYVEVPCQQSSGIDKSLQTISVIFELYKVDGFANRLQAPTTTLLYRRIGNFTDQINDGRNVVFLKNQSLYILLTNLSDYGLYECHWNQINYKSIELLSIKRFEVVLQGAPNVSETCSAHDKKCCFFGYPEPIVSVSSEYGSVITKNSSIQLKLNTVCIAENMFGIFIKRKYFDSFVQIEYRGQIKRPRGHHIDIYCPFHPTNGILKWRLFNNLTSSAEFVSDNLLKFTDGSLRLQNASVQDSGTYQCECINQNNGTKLTANTTIHIEGPPYPILTVVQDELNSVTSVLTLHCRINGIFKHLWWSIGRKISTTQVHWYNYSNFTNNPAIDVNIKEHAHSIVQCGAINEYGVAISKTINISAIINKKTSNCDCFMSNNRVIPVEVGESVTLQCTYFNAQIVSWAKVVDNSTENPANCTDNLINLDSVKEKSNYRCRYICNGIEHTCYTTVTLIKDNQSAFVVNVSSNSIRLSLQAATNSSVGIHYPISKQVQRIIIFKAKSETDDKWKEFIIPTTWPYFTIRNLHANTDYIINVGLKYDERISKYERRWIHVKTKPKTVSNIDLKPSKFKLIEASFQNFKICFQTSGLPHAIRHLSIQTRRVNEVWSRSPIIIDEVPFSTNRAYCIATEKHLVNGLYEVRVIAYYDDEHHTPPSELFIIVPVLKTAFTQHYNYLNTVMLIPISAASFVVTSGVLLILEYLFNFTS
ncbi:hypothetical protein GJ496_001980 [Pomphorhynchus laevis]|nr:hypothetical protein GJ496_001980 [Pomphorhynchus laevis]